jgi:hypothetical protein
MSETFNNGFDLTAEFNDVPTVEYTGLEVGVQHLFVVIPTPKINKSTGEVERFPIRDANGKKLDKMTAQIALQMFCLDEGKVQLVPVVSKEGKIIGMDFVLPDEGRGLLHVSFMNDDNLKVAFKKNNIRDGLKLVHPVTGGLDYGQLKGKIIVAELQKNKDWIDKVTGDKKQGKGSDLVYSSDKILLSNYQCKVQKNEQGELEPSSIMLSEIPHAFADLLMEAYEAIKIQRKQNEDAGSASFNPDEYATGPGNDAIAEKSIPARTDPAPTAQATTPPPTAGTPPFEGGKVKVATAAQAPATKPAW